MFFCKPLSKLLSLAALLAGMFSATQARAWTWDELNAPWVRAGEDQVTAFGRLVDIASSDAEARALVARAVESFRVEHPRDLFVDQGPHQAVLRFCSEQDVASGLSIWIQNAPRLVSYDLMHTGDRPEMPAEIQRQLDDAFRSQEVTTVAEGRIEFVPRSSGCLRRTQTLIEAYGTFIQRLVNLAYLDPFATRNPLQYTLEGFPAIRIEEPGAALHAIALSVRARKRLLRSLGSGNSVEVNGMTIEVREQTFTGQFFEYFDAEGNLTNRSGLARALLDSYYATSYQNEFRRILAREGRKLLDTLARLREDRLPTARDNLAATASRHRAFYQDLIRGIEAEIARGDQNRCEIGRRFSALLPREQQSRMSANCEGVAAPTVEVLVPEVVELSTPSSSEPPAITAPITPPIAPVDAATSVPLAPTGAVDTSSAAVDVATVADTGSGPTTTTAPVVDVGTAVAAPTTAPATSPQAPPPAPPVGPGAPPSVDPATQLAQVSIAASEARMTSVLFIGDSDLLSDRGQAIETSVSAEVGVLSSSYGYCGARQDRLLTSTPRFRTTCGFRVRLPGDLPQIGESREIERLQSLLDLHHPNVVVLALGGSWVAAPEQASTELYRSTRDLVAAVRSSGARCVWLSPLPRINPSGRRLSNASVSRMLRVAIRGRCTIVPSSIDAEQAAFEIVRAIQNATGPSGSGTRVR